MAPPAALVARVRAQGFGPDGGLPVVTLEEFFEGNDDEASIGCNLVPHPGTARFYQVLTSLRSRPDVQDVLVGISEDMGDDEWPFSEYVYVLTTASRDLVAQSVAELQAELLDGDAYYPAAPAAAPAPRTGYSVYTLWWD